MYSSSCTTFARTHLTHRGTALEQNKNALVVWKIENFTRIQRWKISETICGPEFKYHPLSKVLWKLKIRKKRDSYGPRCSRISMGIRKVSGCQSTAFAFTISWRDQTDQESKSVKHVHVPANVSYHLIFDGEMTDFIRNYTHERNNTCNMLIEMENNDCVVRQTAKNVTCDIKVLDFQSSLDKGKLAVLADMESFLKDVEFTDVILRSEGKEMRSHRAILAARSAVFKGMFQNQMNENASGLVDVADISFHTLQSLVSYMYSGRLVDLDVKSASELFVAADKYAVEDLLHTCTLFLKRSLTVENCLDILVLADSHCSNKDLKSSAVAYFSEHSKEICQKPDWRNVVKFRPNVMFELLDVLATLKI